MLLIEASKQRSRLASQGEGDTGAISIAIIRALLAGSLQAG
jgi:hypothetical protein